MMANASHGNVTTVLDDPRPGPQEAGIVEFLEKSGGFFPDDATRLSMDEMRGCYDRLCAHFHGGRPQGMRVDDMTAPGPAGDIGLRRYVPQGVRDGAGLDYLHGGGYVLGSLDSHDDVCAGLAELSGATVIAVDYRLAPEHRFPAAFEDSAAAVEHIMSNAAAFGIDPVRTAIGGDSAGGNLTAAVCLKRRDDRARVPAGQVLIYPTLGGDMDRGSYVSRANAPGLTTADMQAYDSWYMGPCDDAVRMSKFRAPLLETNYEGLPPAFMIACEWDPLRDDCYGYAARLEAAGVAAAVRHEPELVHASLRARHMSQAAGAMFASVAQAVREFTA
jgi:acetyl esterase